MLRMWHCVVLSLLFVGAIHGQSRTVYTFEDASHLSAFTASGTSTLARSTTRYKDATHSMKWTWASGDSITHAFTSNRISGSELRRGGIKLWLYNTHKRTGANEKLTVDFLDTQSSPSKTVSQFKINLNFQGWRGIWVSYAESKLASGDIDTVKIIAPTTTAAVHPLYFDLIRLVNRLTKQTRDAIVPTIGTGIYNLRHFWQQTYRWSQATPTTITETTANQTKLDDLKLIEKRLANWFVKQSQSSVNFTGNVKKRFDTLPVDASHSNFVALGVSKSSEGVITGTPLYAKASEFNHREFGFVMPKVLLPMALDYHIRSREIDVNDLAAAELDNLNGAMDVKNAAIMKIAGADTTMQLTFTTALGSAPYTVEKVKTAIGTLNDKRKERLRLLLDYIEDQGFTDGSGIGSLDHEMNNAGAGFMCAAFVLRKELQAAGKLSDYVATIKWYNDFGEIYQNPFEYAGTTADRMRTISFWRLFAVLMMPSSTTAEKLAKIRDMEALGRWYANALSPNEAFAGTLKPDYLGFHHNSYYASAYTPHAVHKGALIQYLLSGTLFELSAETRGHIKKGLETMRVVSLKYSSPNSVGGRFPGFTRAILSKNFPGYAYAGATAPSLNEDETLGAIPALSTETVQMFLRLYDTTRSVVNDYLGDGSIFTNIYYLNSIGSINIMEEISDKATAMSIAAESSPRGFWSKNYASVAVHRRHDWAVSVKGFNRFVWDFEASGSQNVFGLYQSHGALLVANNEQALQTHDIDNGWDWTRHPGVTTIKLNLDQLISENRRYFQPEKLAGSVRLVGGGDYAAGVWGMQFSQPPYRFPSGSFQLNIDFRFKKSVFFADWAVICLGSSITATNSAPYITQTALFQTKLLDAASPSSIEINSTSHSLGTDLSREPSFFGNATHNHSATLRDVNGNGYYIPDAAAQGLNVKISLQRSRDQRGRTRETSARYATAWLDHGANPSGKGYEYTIVVNRHAGLVRWLADKQASDEKVYEVLCKNDKAHVVKIPNCPRPGQTQYGYVFFDKSVRTPGPVRRVARVPTVVMVEEVDSTNLFLAVSSPDLNFNITRTLTIGSDVTNDERFYAFSMPVEVEVFFRQPVHVATGDVRVNGDIIADAQKSTHVTVMPQSGSTDEGKRVKFLQLSKGFTTEVKLTRAADK